MAEQVKELSYGAIQIFTKESDTLGIGSYGKVCKAKCGQLPCAAKLLHDTMFSSIHFEISRFEEKFEQECQFLRAIKHPNVVQFLGTLRDPQSQRLALLMELMDECLTRFIERSTGPILYHNQLNICHDVALALAYLHSNGIIHRDLSSNNVLLIGNGIRAKVTDFGMSMLEGLNPRMTKLTMCPGTAVYMPPEALITPPQYSSKLDCFSHGVLTIQIATRQFPDPQDATTTIEDVRYPTGRVVTFVPETYRRKDDIDLVAPDHPLLPLALHCLKDRDIERPSADDLCVRLATLKHEPKYTHCLEQSREQNISLKKLQQKLEEKDSELEKARANHETELNECYASYQSHIYELERENCQKTNELMIMKEELKAKDFALQAKTAECDKIIRDLRDECISKLEQHQPSDRSTQGLFPRSPTKPHPKPRAHNKLVHHAENLMSDEQLQNDQLTLLWKKTASAPISMRSMYGAAVVHGKTTYFSRNNDVYAYSICYTKWTELTPCEYQCFALAIVNDKLTTIGGLDSYNLAKTTLLCLNDGKNQEWDQLLPQMAIDRVRPAAITTPTHLVVAGGRSGPYGEAISTVEILALDTLQWSTASGLPKPLWYPHMTLCGKYLYVSKDNTLFSCAVEELVKKNRDGDSRSVWTRLANIPIPCEASLATVRGRVLALGGKRGRNPTGVIHCYNRSTNSWSVIGEIPTSRCDTLVAVLPTNQLIVAGGEWKKRGAYTSSDVIEIANTQ